MQTPLKNVWKELAGLFAPSLDDSALAKKLFREYERNGFIDRSAGEILQYNLPVIVNFFYRIGRMHSSESPILRRRDARWMSEFDYTLVNIRAAGAGHSGGDFLRASFFLSTLQTRGIILAPVTKGGAADLKHLESHVLIREELANEQALEAGISPEMQMTAFCEAAHSLRLVIGFEMDYRVDPLAAAVLHRPELFFWVRDGRFMPDETIQNEIRSRVRGLLMSVKSGMDRNAVQSVLNAASIAPKPSRDGSGRTPLALKKIDPATDGGIRETAVDYWSRIFGLWRDRFGFDFLVLRGTRSMTEADDEVPSIPIIHRVADAARKAGVRRNIGVAAEGHFTEVEDFGLQGVDLVIINDAQARADRQWFLSVFQLDVLLCRINLGRKIRFSVPLEVNPGEENSPAKRNRALIRRFIARFLGVGPSRRPILETMGALEGAWGFYGSIAKPINMRWAIEEDAALRGRNIEEVAVSFRYILKHGEIDERHVDDQTAWWVIRSRAGVLIAVVSVENEARLSPQSLTFDCSKYIKQAEEITVVEYDFQDARGILHLSAGMALVSTDIPYGDFRLYAIATGGRFPM